MYIVKNNGSYPVIIRDLNLHISGGKSVDLDTLFNPDTVRRSVDLSQLISKNKVSLLQKEKIAENKTVVDKPIPKQSQDQLKLDDFKKDLLEIKEMLRSGAMPVAVVEKESHDEETIKRITNLQVQSLSTDSENVEKNFEHIGKSTEKKEKLDQLLDVLDSLDNGG